MHSARQVGAFGHPFARKHAMNTVLLGQQTSGGVEFEDYDTGDGYHYRQYDDGTILILRSPTRAYSKGTEPSVTPQSNAKAWKAITAQLADLKSGKKSGKAANTWEKIFAITTASLPIVANMTAPRRSSSKTRAPQRGAPITEMVSSASSWSPSLWSVGAVAGGLVVVALILRGPR